MADLIIKPTAGSGNKLIFKDQAGNSIITTADSGGTIDSGVTWTSPILPSPVINTAVSGSAFLDEDNLVSDSATKLASQQSIKAYADTKAPLASPTFTGTVAIPNVANVETAVVANTAKVTNATHTGDVTGATALTIAVDAVDIPMLSATGTASATTYLRGDNAWVAAHTDATFTGDTTFTGGITEKSGTATATGTTITVDLDTGNFFIADLEGVSGNVVTFTISNINSTSNQVSNFVLKIIQGTTTTTRNITWATVVSNGTNIDWAGGTGPDITTGADKVDILAFTSYDNGTTWYGAIVGQDFS